MARIRTLARPHRGRITAAGIQPTRTVSLNQTGVHCYIGASSSPRLVVVTRLDAAMVEVLDPYSGECSTHARWIAEDLIAQGCETWLKSWATQWPDEAERLLDFLAGKPVDVRPMSAWDKVAIRVRSADGSDRWRDAEQYGSVAGINDTDLLEISGFRFDVEQVSMDARFVVLDVEVQRSAA